MAGELKAFAECTPAHFAALASVEGLAMALWRQDPRKVAWEDEATGIRNVYRQRAVRLMIEHHNNAQAINALQVYHPPSIEVTSEK